MTLSINTSDHTNKGIDARFQALIDAINALGGGGGSSVKRVAVTAAEILTLGSVPLEILPAPGAGNAYVVFGGCIVFYPGATPYAGAANADDLALFIGDPQNDVWFTKAWESGPDILQQSDVTIVWPEIFSNTAPGAMAFIGAGLAATENRPAFLALPGGSNPSNGNGTLVVNVVYATVAI